MNISLDASALKDILGESILASLDQPKRDALIKGALTHLLEKPAGNGGYYGRQSPIEEAFHTAVRHVAEKIATEMLGSDEGVKAKVRELLNEALVRLTETNREATVAKLADAIAAGMAYRSRD